ncbi:MAG: OsmC family protein [Fimbriimonas sp.]|nr:OsmC family protein [Fimbriimonas sp.]
MSTIHEYPATVTWTGGREGQGTIANHHSGTQIGIAVPTEFQGTGSGSNPEELLTSAVAGCYTITFGIVAANRKVPIERLEVDVVGSVEQNGASLTFKQITIRPKITLSSDATEAQVASAADLAHKADGYCIVTNAVRGKVEVIVDPVVTRAD